MALVGMGLRTFSSFRGRNANRRAWNISRIDCDMHFAKYFPNSLASHFLLPAWKSFVVLASRKRVGISKKSVFVESLCALTLPKTLGPISVFLTWNSLRPCWMFSSVQFSPMTNWEVGGGVNKRDDSPEILFQSFMQEALVRNSGVGRNVHSLMLSIQHFLCQPRRRPPSKVPWRMIVSERLLWRVACPNHASVRLLTVSRRRSCGPAWELILLRTQSLVLRSKKQIQRSFLWHLVSRAWTLFWVNKHGPCFTATEEDGSDKRLLELELACEVDDVVPLDTV